MSGAVGNDVALIRMGRSVYIGAVPKSKPANVIRTRSYRVSLCQGSPGSVSGHVLNALVNTIRYVLPGAHDRGSKAA